jgi:hypothetical protein
VDAQRALVRAVEYGVRICGHEGIDGGREVSGRVGGELVYGPGLVY